MINSALILPKWQFVGVAGFEPATSCSQSRRDNRATLHPEGHQFSRCKYNTIFELFKLQFIYSKAKI